MIANKIVEEYMANQLETKSEGARRAAEWLETRLAELGDTVKSLEQDVDRQRAESGSNSIGIVSQRLGELTSQLVSAQTATAAAGARYDQVRDGPREPRQLGRPPRDHRILEHSSAAGQVHGAARRAWRICGRFMARTTPRLSRFAPSWPEFKRA